MTWLDKLSPGDPVSVYASNAQVLVPARVVLRLDDVLGVVVAGTFARIKPNVCSPGHQVDGAQCVGVGLSAAGWAPVEQIHPNPAWDANLVAVIAGHAGFRIQVAEDGPRLFEVAIGVARQRLVEALDGLDPEGLVAVGIALCGLRERTMPLRWGWVSTLPARNAALAVQALGALLGLTPTVPEFAAPQAAPGASAGTPPSAEAPTRRAR